MRKKKIHYMVCEEVLPETSDMAGLDVHYIACGKPIWHAVHMQDPEKVTCKTCLHILSKRKKT